LTLSGAAEEGVMLQVIEQIGGQPVVIGGLKLPGVGSHRINFTPTGSMVYLQLLGPYVMKMGSVCVTYPQTVQETYLAEICDEDKDRYRFGFNGQEKVNEIAGIGNH